MPCSTTFCADVGVDIDGVHEPEAADGCDETRRRRGRIHVDVFECVETSTEVFAERQRARDKVFVNQDVEGGAGYGASERIAAVCGAVLTGFNAVLIDYISNFSHEEILDWYSIP